MFHKVKPSKAAAPLPKPPRGTIPTPTATDIALIRSASLNDTPHGHADRLAGLVYRGFISSTDAAGRGAYGQARKRTAPLRSTLMVTAPLSVTS
jgi:hypothetical protein